MVIEYMYVCLYTLGVRTNGNIYFLLMPVFVFFVFNFKFLIFENRVIILCWV